MKKKIENTYGKALRGIFVTINPIKRRIIKTHCTVHKYICVQSIEILKNRGYEEQYQFYKEHIRALNAGATWADQDFKSSNHFYHYHSGTGLYGFSNALLECKKYYASALKYVEAGDVAEGIFYFGAACHLVQDTTVPQHVNNKLLKNHRKFELWIISKLMTDFSFVEQKDIIEYNTLDEYIKNNAVLANNTYIKYINIEQMEERYHKIATIIIKEAQKTTAGLMLNFYNEIKRFIN